MKSIYLLTSLFAILLSPSVFGQVILVDQNFESGSLPSGWLRQQSNPSKGWEFGDFTTLASGYLAIPDHTKFAASNDDKNDNQAATQNVGNRDMLITPAMNLTTMTAGRLEFSTYFTGAFGSVATVEISIDGGATWSVFYTIPSASGWQTLSLDLNGYLTQTNVKFAFVHNDGGLWADGVAVDDVKVFQPTPNDVQLVSVNLPSSSTVGSLPVEISVRNYGTSTLNSFTFDYSTDGGTTTHTDQVNGLGLAPGASVTLTHNTPLIIIGSGTITVAVNLSLPNGQQDISNNNSASKSVNFLLGTTDKFVLVEEHTGAWCQYCPDGAVQLAAILAANNDVIGVAIHNADGMDFGDGNTVANAFIGGFPSGTVDRYLFTGESEVGLNRGDWAARSVQRKANPSLVSLTATNSYNTTSRMLTVDVSAEFMADLTGNYRLNVYIVEDSITGTGNDYNQKNAFNNVTGHPYYQAGNPIIGYVHRDVVRYFMGGAWGLVGSIPTTIDALTPYDKTFTYTLPVGWNADRIHLVVVMQKYGTSSNDREVLNALKLELNNTAATNIIIADDVHAIDVSSVIHSVCGGGKEGEIFVTPVGCTDCTFTWSNGQTGPSAFSLAPGTYTVTMENNSGVSVTESFTIYGPIALNANVVLNGGTADVTLNIAGGTPPYTIGWSNGSTASTITNLASGSYEITVIDNNGCSTVQNLRVGYAVGVNDVASIINFDVFPNPTSGNVTVNADLVNNTTVTIQVFSTLGALVNETILNGTAQVRQVVDLSAQANGVYIVKVTADGTSGVRRLVLNR